MVLVVGFRKLATKYDKSKQFHLFYARRAPHGQCSGPLSVPCISLVIQETELESTGAVTVPGHVQPAGRGRGEAGPGGIGPAPWRERPGARH